MSDNVYIFEYVCDICCSPTVTIESPLYLLESVLPEFALHVGVDSVVKALLNIEDGFLGWIDGK